MNLADRRRRFMVLYSLRLYFMGMPQQAKRNMYRFVVNNKEYLEGADNVEASIEENKEDDESNYPDVGDPLNGAVSFRERQGGADEGPPW